MHSCWKEHGRGEETKIPLGKVSSFAEKGVGREQRAVQPDPGGGSVVRGSWGPIDGQTQKS